MNVRPYRNTDDTGIAELLHDLHQRQSPYPGPIAGTTPEEHLAWLTRNPMDNRYVTEHHGRMVGHVGISNPGPHFPPDTLEIVRLFTSAQRRHQGIGTALLQHAVSAIRARRQTPVLEVSHYLTDARNLYRAHHFRPIGTRISPLTQDTLIQYILAN